MVISLLETVIITNVLHHNSMKYREVPSWVQVVVLRYIAGLICYRRPEEPPKTELTKTDSGDPWTVHTSHTASSLSANSSETHTHTHYTCFMSWLVDYVWGKYIF